MNKNQIQQATKMLLEGIGEDLNREGIQKTPQRVADMMEEILSGYTTDLSEFKKSIFSDQFSDMVLVKDIEFYSICEHHMVPFFGKAHIAFIPDGRLIGLSKISRIIDAFAKRLQVQERMTDQIADCLEDILNPKGIAVSIEANHLCTMMRGIKKQHSSMVTQKFSGVFRENKGYLEQFLVSIGENINETLDLEGDI